MPAAFTDEEMKILVLFALNSAGGFSDTETLCNIVAAADANYIDTKTAIASLVSLGLVTDYNDEGEKFTVNNGEIGETTQYLYDTLTGIQWGKTEDTFGWTYLIG